MGLITQVDGCLLNEENYEIDNGFFSLDFKKTMSNLRARQGVFLGLSKAPWPHNGCGQALVYEDENNFSNLIVGKNCIIIRNFAPRKREKDNFFRKR